MAGWALAASGSQVDAVARVLAIAGLGVAIVSVALNGYQWRRSGPALKVRINWRRVKAEGDDRRSAESELDGAMVMNSGRMPAVVVLALLLPVKGGWERSWELKPAEGEFPVTIPPTGFCHLILAGDDGPSPEEGFRAVAVRGDGRRFRSRPFPGRTPSPG
jgi:hypothetical protein